MTRIHKGFAYYLIFILLITGINFSQITTASAASTGTDLDNFTIKLNWGEPDENLPDTLSINKTNKSKESIKLQVSIEYRGDGTTTYNPEEISFTLTDIKDILCDNVHYGVYSYNIAAELKGSNSGIGDWYYTKTESKDSNNSLGANTFTFTNKNKITGAFTSSFQIIYTIDAPEQTHSTYTKSFAAKLNADGASKDSNSLTLNWSAKKDVWTIGPSAIEKLSEDTPEILSKLPANADPDDYIFVQARYTFDYDSYTTIMNQGKMDITLPSDAIAGDAVFTGGANYLFGGITETTRTSAGVTIKSYDYKGGYEDAHDLIVPLAFPRETYKDRTITLDANLSGRYAGETVFIDLDTNQLQISFPNFLYIYNGQLYSLKKELYNYTSIMAYGNLVKAFSDNDYLRKRDWDFDVRTTYIGTPYDIEVCEDLSYIVYPDKSFRRMNDNEVFIRTVSIPQVQAGCYADLYGRPKGSDDYELYQENIRLSGPSYADKEFDVSGENYCAVKFVIKNVTTNVNEDFRISIAYGLDTSKDNGKIAKYIYNFASLDIIMNGQGLLNDNTAVTNITGLDTAVDNYDIAESGDKRYRCVNYGIIGDYPISDSLILTGETSSVTNASIPIELSNMFEITDYVGGTEIKYVDYTISVPKYVDYSFDDFRGSFNYSTYVELKSGKQINTANWKEYASFSSVKNADGTSTVKIHLDFSSDPLITRKTVSSNYLRIFFNGYTSYDDYIMFDLAGKKMEFKTTVEYSTVDGDSDSIYDTERIQYPMNATATYQAVEKKVISENQGYFDNTAETDLGGNYSYKLKLSAGDTAVKYAVLFDNLETAHDNKTHWSGAFTGIDTSSIEEVGANPSIYYSTDSEQSLSLSAPGWVESSNWTKSMSEVKSIAVDLGDYVIPASSVAYVEVNMKAPANAKGCAYNKYSTSYKAYPAGSTNMTPDNAQETITNLFSNKTTVTLPATEQEIRIAKQVNRDDFIAAHGNGETFIYKITSDDNSVWYKSIHFAESDFEAGTGDTITKTESVILPYGTFVIEELKTTRFSGDIIDTSGNMTKKTKTTAEAIVDSSASESIPTVVFKNVKDRWDKFSHSDLVLNTLSVQ